MPTADAHRMSVMAWKSVPVPCRRTAEVSAVAQLLPGPFAADLLGQINQLDQIKKLGTDYRHSWFQA